MMNGRVLYYYGDYSPFINLWMVLACRLIIPPCNIILLGFFPSNFEKKKKIMILQKFLSLDSIDLGGAFLEL